MPKSKLSLAASLFLLIPLFIFFWPVLIPIAVTQHLIVERRKLKCVEKTHCHSCAALLGAGSIARADQCWSEHMSALHREYPGTRLRVVRTLHAVCICGEKYSYDERMNNFVPLTPES